MSLEWRDDDWHGQDGFDVAAAYALGTAPDPRSVERRLEQGILGSLGAVLAEQEIPWPEQGD